MIEKSKKVVPSLIQFSPFFLFELLFYTAIFLLYLLQLERLIGEHRSASSLMSAVSASNDAANSSKILAAERAKFVGACVRAVEHLQRYEEHFHAGTGLLLRSHDTIVSKWLGRGDVLPQRGDHQEYAPNLMSHEYVLAALFLSEPS